MEKLLLSFDSKVLLGIFETLLNRGIFLLNDVNPEAIGVFALIVTVFVFGLEQLGIGVSKNSDMQKVSRSLANIALVFGGFCQLFTAFALCFFDI